MRLYGSIQTSFWGSTDIQQLSDQGKLLIAYLLTGPHTNMLGCFRLPLGYIESDLQWERHTVNHALNELSRNNFILYDEPSNWLLIHHFLKFNAICNPRQGICVEKLFAAVPTQSNVFKPLINSLLAHGKHLLSTFIDRLHTLNEMTETVKKDCVTEQEQNQEQEQNKKMDMSSDSHSNSFQQPSISRKAQAMEVLDFLNSKTGRVYRPVDNNLKLIMGRLKSGASVLDCRQVIAKKTREWRDNPKMAEFLRPATLFNPTKFEQYVGELVAPKEECPHE